MNLTFYRRQRNFGYWAKVTSHHRDLPGFQLEFPQRQLLELDSVQYQVAHDGSLKFACQSTSHRSAGLIFARGLLT